jgi:hypothetical protein
MDLFLAHCLLLTWASLGAAQKLAADTSDRLLAAALIAWGNIVTTSLVLSCLHHLGDPGWYFGASLLLAALTILAVGLLSPAIPVMVSVPTLGGKPNRWLAAAFFLALMTLAGANGWIAWTYPPSGDDALSFHLPRAMYYLGQGSLAPFDTADLRQTRLPFNFNLLQAFGLVYGPPLQVMNLFSLTAWGISGLAVYRLCRQWACGANASLLTVWLVLTAPFVLAAATFATPALASAAALACAGVFALQWNQTAQLRHALLAGLALGLAAGSSLGLFLLTPVLLIGAGWTARKRRGFIRTWILPGFLALAISAPFAGINLAVTGKLLEPGLVLSLGRPSSLQELLPSLLILSPCLAVLIEILAAGSRALRATGWSLALAVALAASWSGATDLLVNPGRPLAALLQGGLAPAGMPTLPLLMEFHLKDQPHINIDTDDANESIFPVMAPEHRGRFTSQWAVVPDAYNLLSRASLSRNASYLDARGLPAYTLLPIPDKHSSGVEFLASIGNGADARDYFGLAPRAGELKPYDSNRNLLVTIDYGSRAAAGRIVDARIKVAGLNPPDQARLLVIQKNKDGRTTTLATFSENGTARVSIRPPFTHLLFKVVNATDGAELGSTTLPFLPLAVGSRQPIDPLQPTSTSSIFVADAIVSRNSNVISCEGLLPVEGPFPQWNLPYIRWAKQPSVRLTIPATPQLARLRVSFSVQPQVRHEAELDVLFNGKIVAHYQLKERAVWLDQTLELVPQAGENVLEFNDATYATEPDWADYLEHNPDVKAYLEASKIPLEAGAREHFDTHGRAEGRVLRRRTTNRLEPAPQSYYFIYRSIRLEGFKSP